MSDTITVLVAEDDRFLASAYKVKLTKAGFSVAVAANGEEALVLMRKKAPSIVLLDLIMPIKDGFSVLEEMSKDENLKGIPVIIASNLGQKADIDKGLALGAKDFVIKSDLSLDDIISKIKLLIAR